MVDEATFTKIHSTLHTTFSRNGMWWIFLGKLIPSVKAFIPIVAGLADTKTKVTAFVFLLASILWAIMITTIGYYFGQYVSLASFSTVSFLIACVIIAIIYKKYWSKK